MRKPIMIESDKAGCLYKYCLEQGTSHRFAKRHPEMNGRRMIGLKGTITEIIKNVLANQKAASLELWGREDYEPHEVSAMEYLKSVIA
jgi:hypothetical protein